MKEPPKDHYCAVSFELLLEPEQTDCCGNHFTREIAEHLKRGGKPCPICKAPQMTTRPDKFHRRKVNELEVRCLYKAAGNCPWVGELGNLRYHATNCPKQRWNCTHCDFIGLKEEEDEHTRTCELLPTECPNKCEVKMIPRGQLKQHKQICSLEVVSCKYSAFGCTKRLPRRDLKRHLEEGETEHLIKMCTLNLTLTQQLVQKVAEKDAQIARLQTQLSTMEQELRNGVKNVQEMTATKSLEIERRIESEVKGLRDHVTRSEEVNTSCMGTLRSSLSGLQHQVNAISCNVPPVEFTVTNFEALKLYKLEWRSPPFYTHCGGYKMCIGVSPYGVQRGFGTHVSLRVYKMLDYNSDRLPWNIRIRIRVHVQNQSNKSWDHEYVDDSVRSKPDDNCVGSCAEHNYLRHSELRQYVKHDQLRIRVTELAISTDSSRFEL